MIKLKNILLVFGCVCLFYACKKEKSYLYEVNDVTIIQPGSDKQNIKTNIEFISIAHSDIFSKAITPKALVDISLAYQSFGDKKIIEDLIIRNFLKEVQSDTKAKFPTTIEMRNDLNGFISETYKRLFNRSPNEFELWYMNDLITKNSNVTPDLIYYSLMTTNEYRVF